MESKRTILHVDMDAFFAAVEVLDRPELAGKALLIGGDGPRGVVSTASYEARRFGCHSAQPMSIALRRCPHAIVLPPNGKRYREISHRVFEIFDDFSPLVEPLSIDEAFLDLTGTEHIHGSGVDAANLIRKRIRNEIGLTASIGVAANKFLAKLASDYNKPDGLTVVTPDMMDDWLAAMPIGRLWGVGKATEAKFETMNVRTIGQLRRLTEDELIQRFGNSGARFFRLSRGMDDRPVVPDREAKSISQEHTFGIDVEDPDQIRRMLLSQVDQVSWRLRKHGFKARSVTVKIRFGDFETVTRSHTLPSPTDTTETIWHAAKDVFDKWAKRYRPVRLIGVGVSQFGGEEQLSLFGQEESEQNRKMDQLTDQIRDRFGKHAIRRGGTLG